MTNSLTASGLTTDTLQEIITDLEDGLKAIYGDDINIESNSPDGQRINIDALIVKDILNLLVAINNSFDPDLAQGVTLDQRVAINNIQRAGATYTFQDVIVTVDRALNLQGLDADANNPDGVGFTVSDDEGNQFILLDSQSPISAGSYTYSFRAKNLGAIETSLNTITNIDTVILGVTSVNNTTTQSTLGIDEETDFQLRERRRRSPAIRSKAALDGILANLLSLEGVVNASVYENVTNSTDSNGLPPHSMYAIVEGGANADIADQISKYKSVGCDMLGDVEIDVEIADNTYPIKFDRPASEPLYIRFGIKETTSGQTFDQTAIKDYIIENKTYEIGEIALADDLNEIAKDAILATAGNVGTVVNLEISSDNSNWEYYIEAANIKDKWNLSAGNIAITIL